MFLFLFCDYKLNLNEISRKEIDEKKKKQQQNPHYFRALNRSSATQ